MKSISLSKIQAPLGLYPARCSSKPQTIASCMCSSYVPESLPWHCICISGQNHSFVGTASHLIPALTAQSTCLWGITLDHSGSTRLINRELLPYEHLGVQGYPILLHRAHPWTSLVPQCLRFAYAYNHPDALPGSTLRKLAGNAMHVSAISLALLWAILCIEAIG